MLTGRRHRKENERPERPPVLDVEVEQMMRVREEGSRR